MKLDTEGGLPIGKTSDDLSSLCVPKLYDLVKACAQESSPIVAKANVSYGLTVTHVGPQASSVGKNIPDFDCSIMTS